jgi:hypothetical protein
MVSPTPWQGFRSMSGGETIVQSHVLSASGLIGIAAKQTLNR